MTERRISRRNFVAAASVAGLFGGGAGTPWSDLSRLLPVADADDESLPKLGVASYSLRNFTREQALEMTRSLGVKYINFKSVHLPYDASPTEFATARSELAAAGLQLVGGGTITFENDTDEGVKKYFDYARAAGMPTIVCTCKPSVLPRIEKFARQYDIKVAIHNHGPEDENFPSPYDALRSVKGMDPRMGLCIDLGHTVRAGTDPVQAIADARSRVLDMHAKDLRDFKSADSQCIVGEGEIPIAAIFRQLRAIGYRGYVNLEYEIEPDNPLAGMKQS
ncbi:MAG TPA: sugar phosphate isomerase/epimerase, partial [Gemmatimonadaceae bacterium]|nr:sugar phosphate isomerase/epimerase [Gemmatimonadaceae bacterium]